MGDGYSFRGFVERLNEQSEREDGSEAPVLEEGTEGVRIMTVHSAKGLEFPVVILADMTANIASRRPDKHVKVDERLCAVRLLGCSPWDLIDHEEDECGRDEAEGVRIAYVAATRARDLLVVTAVGDAERAGWTSPLNKAIYPAKGRFRVSAAAPLCPEFGDATVLKRPMEYDGGPEISVRPGLHQPEFGTHAVVWWDPSVLHLEVEPSFGLRREEILTEERDERSEESLQLYEAWKSRRQASIETGHVPSLNVFLATDAIGAPAGYSERVRVDRVPREDGRPGGPRFGSLVHVILRDVDFSASPESIERLARTHARLLNATAEEISAASQAAAAALRHPLMDRARNADRCYRELPIVIPHGAAGLLEAVMDLVFVEAGRWTIIDFKTDAEDPKRLAKYRHQAGWYLRALDLQQQTRAEAWLLHI
jgi:ATP-dependent exoDNAse (exonuclease V) beta subunit